MTKSRSPGRGWSFILALLMACLGAFFFLGSALLCAPGVSRPNPAPPALVRAGARAGQALSCLQTRDRAQSALAIEAQEPQADINHAQLRPARRAAQSHPAAHRLLFGKLPSELASRTGGHAPPALFHGFIA